MFEPAGYSLSTIFQRWSMFYDVVVNAKIATFPGRSLFRTVSEIVEVSGEKDTLKGEKSEQC